MTSTNDGSGIQEVRSVVRRRLRLEGLDVPVGATGDDMLGLLAGRCMKGEGIAMLEALLCVEELMSARSSIRERTEKRLREACTFMREFNNDMESSQPEYDRYLRNRRAVDHVITPDGTFSMAFGAEKVAPNAARLALASKNRADTGRAFAQALQTELELLDERRPDELRADLDWEHGGARLAFIARLKEMGMTPMRIAELFGYAPEGVDRGDRVQAQERQEGSKRVRDHLRHFSLKLQKNTSPDELS